MAIKKCRECGHEVSSEAKICPSCGIKSPAQEYFGCLPSLAVIVFAIFAIGYCASPSSTTKLSPPANPPITTAPSVQTPSPPEQKEKSPQWFYNTMEDKMGRGKIKTATIISANSLEFGFPYQGEQWPHLVLRNHPKYGKDAYITIDRGQFLCGYDDCNVYVRFGDGKPQKFSASEASDHSTTTLFLGDFAKFLKGVRKADKIYIEAEFYNNGIKVMEFDTAGLKWD